MNFRKATFVLMLSGCVLSISTIALVRAANENGQPATAPRKDSRTAAELAHDQMISAFPGKVDIFLIGTDIKQPALADVRIGEVLETPAGLFCITYSADGSRSLINPSQIAMVRVNKK